MLSVRTGPHLASGKLLFCTAACGRDAGLRRSIARARGSPVHLLSGKRSETTGGEHPYRNTGRTQLYIVYQGEVKQLVESTHTEVRDERSFTLLEDVNCPAVLAEQCFVTSEEDVAQFGSEEGCKKAARIYYEAICEYFGTQPQSEQLAGLSLN